MPVQIIEIVNSIVTIPKSNIQYIDWNGTGYIVSDPATGAAGYMISGGIAGGSSSIAVDLASAVSMIIGVVMLIGAVGILLGETTLIGGVIGLALAAVTMYYLVEVINQMYMYYILGDYEAGQQLIGEAILGIVGMVAGTVIGKIFEALGIDIGAILGRVIKWLDEVGNGIATKLLDLGFSRESIMEITEEKGVKGLEALVEDLSELKSFVASNGIRATDDIISKVYTVLCKKNLDFSKRILLSTKQVVDGKTVSELVDLLRLVERPAASSLTNYEARVWYTWQKSLIGSKMDFSKPLEQVARDACDMRNSIRRMARDAMQDQELAQFLDAQEPMAIFEQLIQKYTGPEYGLRGDALWNRIIEGSMKGRGLVDDLFGITY